MKLVLTAAKVQENLRYESTRETDEMGTARSVVPLVVTHKQTTIEENLLV